MSKKAKIILLVISLYASKIAAIIAIITFSYKFVCDVLHDFFETCIMAILGVFIFTAFVLYGSIPPTLPDTPEFNYGEYPFEIVYSVNEDVYTKSGVLTCSLDMRTETASFDWYWYWDESFKNEDEDILCNIDGIDIYIDCGNGHYYMQDSKAEKDYAPGQLFYYDDYEKTEITPTVAKQKYGLEIISAKFSEPMSSMHKTKPSLVATTLACNILALFAFIIATRFTVRKYCYGVFKRCI